MNIQTKGMLMSVQGVAGRRLLGATCKQGTLSDLAMEGAG